MLSAGWRLRNVSNAHGNGVFRRSNRANTTRTVPETEEKIFVCKRWKCIEVVNDGGVGGVGGVGEEAW